MCINKTHYISPLYMNENASNLHAMAEHHASNIFSWPPWTTLAPVQLHKLLPKYTYDTARVYENVFAGDVCYFILYDEITLHICIT